MSEWFDVYGFDEVRGNLLVGAYPQDAEDVAALAAAGVTRVFSLVSDGEYDAGARGAVEAALRAEAMQERRLPLVDFGGLSPGELQLAVDAVLAWLAAGERVYVHCRAGLQRSAAVAAGVLAVRDGIELDEALLRIAARRPGAAPLSHQRCDLERWWEMRSA